MNSSPDLFGHWLTVIARRTAANLPGDERVVFINAWKSWPKVATWSQIAVTAMHIWKPVRQRWVPLSLSSSPRRRPVPGSCRPLTSPFQSLASEIAGRARRL